MRKLLIGTLLVCLLLCLVACGGTTEPETAPTQALPENIISFPDSNGVLDHLQGMWEVQTAQQEKSYYIFRDNQVYTLTDEMYIATATQLLNSALQNGGVESLSNQTFKSISSRIYLSDLATSVEAVTCYPATGMLKFNEGKSNAETIYITSDGVLLQRGSDETHLVMAKFSDTVDLTLPTFEILYNNAAKNLAAPSQYFWVTPSQYAEALKGIIPAFDWWVQTEITATVSVYEPVDGFTTIEGSSLVVSQDSLTYVYDLNVYNYNGTHPEVLLSYTPNLGSFSVLDTNNYSLDMKKWIVYGGYVAQNFPGAYADLEALYYDITAVDPVVSNGQEIRELTVNGVTYTLTISQDGITGQFKVTAEDTVAAGELLEIYEPVAATDPSEQGGTLEQLLDSSKVWAAPWTDNGWEYNIFYVFEDDGTCYFALGDFEVYGAGVGKYTVKDDNVLSVEITMLGKKCSATYKFNPSDFSLTITKNGLVGKVGEVFCMEEYTDAEVADVKKWGKLFTKGTPKPEDWE